MYFTKEEFLEDLTDGQTVIITARWILILSAWVLVLWQPGQIAIGQLQLQIVLLMAYTIGNFFLTIQWMKHSETMPMMVYASMIADLSLVTILVLALGGFDSNLYVFYFPALFALSVTFPKPVAVTYALVALGAYGFIALADASGPPGLTTAEAQSIVTRLIIMAGVAFCAGLYRSLEADRRAGKGRMFEIFKSGGSPEASQPTEDQPQR